MTSHRYAASTPYSSMLTGSRPKARTRASRISTTTPVAVRPNLIGGETAAIAVDDGIHQRIGLVRAMAQQRQREQRVRDTQNQDEQCRGQPLRRIPVGHRNAGILDPARPVPAPLEAAAGQGTQRPRASLLRDAALAPGR